LLRGSRPFSQTIFASRRPTLPRVGGLRALNPQARMHGAIPGAQVGSQPDSMQNQLSKLFLLGLHPFQMALIAVRQLEPCDPAQAG